MKGAISLQTLCVRGRRIGCVEAVCARNNNNTKPLSSAHYNFGLECAKSRNPSKL